MRSGGPLPATEAAAVVARVGGALAAAARVGVRHGRVCADSVLFDEAGAAYLADFPLGTGAGADGHGDLVGLAALAGEMTRSGTAGAAGPAGTAGPAELAAPAPVLATPIPAGTDGEAIASFVASVVAALDAAHSRARSPRPNPYKGLRAFDEPDAADFFGRDRDVDEIVARLSAPGEAGRFALVVGASGSGKSSLVRAGLLPRVRRGAAPGSASWFVAAMTPGKAPFDELADALRLVAVSDPAGLGRELASGAGGLDRAVRRLVPPGGELLLVVDQLEELFTLAPAGEQRAFLDALVTAVTAPGSRLRVVATLRADFYDRPLGVESTAPLVGDATVAVGVMTPAELEAAIVGPATRVGATVEAPLVAELVGAVAQEPAALPSLQFTLTELADRSDGDTLTLAAYGELGGVEGAIAARAEDLYQTLAPGSRAGVRRMFEQLVVIGGSEPTRHRALVADVVAALPDDGADGAGDDAADCGADHVVELWAGARLLTLDRHPDTRAPTVEVAHEALLREWPRLRDWLAEDRDDITALGHLREAAAEWEALDRDQGGLYRGARLEQALHVAGRPGRTLPPAERTFLEASRTERDAERRREARRVRRLRAQLATVAVALVVSLLLGGVAVAQRNRASDRGRLAEARELAAAANASLDVDPERSILLALAAVDRSRAGDGEALPEAVEALHTAVASSRIELRVPGLGGWVDWSPAGDTFVTEGPEDSGEVDIRDAATGESVLRWRGHDPDVNAVEYSADGELLLTTGDDGAARVWDAATGELVQEMVGAEADSVWGPSLSPDGKYFAATWPGGNVARVAEVATGEVVAEVRSLTTPFDTAFGPDGQVAVSSRDPSYRHLDIFDAATGDTLRSLDLDGDAGTLAWSPDGASLAVTSEGGVVVWDMATGTRRISLLGHDAVVDAIDWNADSTVVATGSGDGTVRVWLLLEGGARELFTLTAQDMRAGVAGVSFAPDGSRLLTGNGRVTSARIWDVGVGGDAEVVNLPSVALGFPGAAYVDDRELVAAAPGGSLTVWQAEGPRPVRVLSTDDAAPADPNPLVLPFPSGEEVGDTATSESGRAVAATTPVSGTASHDLVAWDPATGEELFRRRLDPALFAMAWSGDGEWLAISDVGHPDRPGRAYVLDRSGEVAGEVEVDVGSVIGNLAFRSDGLLVTEWGGPDDEGEWRGNVTTWDWREGRAVDSFDVGPGQWTAISDDGRWAATLRGDDRLAVWDVATGRRLAVTTGPNAGTQVIAFGPGGRTMAAGSTDGAVRLWDARDGHEVVTLRGHIGVLSALDFSADGSQLASSSIDGRVRVWALRLDDLEEIARDNVTRGLTTDECRRYLHEARCPA